MTVWLVLRGGWGDDVIEGVYANEADAQAHAEYAVRSKQLRVEGFAVWDEFSEDRFTKGGELRAAAWREMDVVRGYPS